MERTEPFASTSSVCGFTCCDLNWMKLSEGEPFINHRINHFQFREKIAEHKHYRLKSWKTITICLPAFLGILSFGCLLCGKNWTLSNSVYQFCLLGAGLKEYRNTFVLLVGIRHHHSITFVLAGNSSSLSLLISIINGSTNITNEKSEEMMQLVHICSAVQVKHCHCQNAHARAFLVTVGRCQHISWRCLI